MWLYELRSLFVIFLTCFLRETFARDGLSIKDFSFEPMNLQRVNQKPNVLRETYADACIKLAVRKCYKALVAVNKNVCKVRYRCSSSFRSYFRAKSKEGCITNFDNSKVIMKNIKNKKIRTSAKFRDATRERYLDACIPYMVPNFKKSTGTITLRSDTLTNNIANILRKISTSEKTCSRLSREKCATSCFFALRETCAKFKCSRKRTAYHKACKEECRRAYRVERSDSSDSSSD